MVGDPVVGLKEREVAQTDPSKEKQQELRLFLFITVVLFPLLSVILVGGYGLLIWISQMIFGPPGV